MTGRRAMGGWDQRLSRALQFQPGHVGGRVASAQPILRRGGTLRRPSIGATAVAEVPYMGDAFGATDHFSLGVSTVGDVTIDVMYDATTQPHGVVASAGDTVLLYAVGVSTGWTAPTGWTVVASGTAGDLDWLVASGTLTGTYGTSLTLPDLSPGWTDASGDAGTWTVLWWTFEGMVAGTWHASPASALGAASMDWAVPSDSWWASAASDYWSINLASAICVDYGDSIPHDPGRYVADEAWVTGYGRRLETFTSSFIVGSPYSTGTITEQWASTSGSDYLMVGIGWTP